MNDEENAEVKSALDLLQEFDYVSWYQEAFGIVLNYIIKLEKEIENLQGAISKENCINRAEMLNKIITRIEQTRDKDKLCEYPYNRCIRILKEEFENDKSNIKI